MLENPDLFYNAKSCRTEILQPFFVYTAMPILVSTVAAQNVLNLVLNQSLDVIASRSQILTWVEMLRMLSEVLTDTSSESQTQIGVNINLANCAASCLAELILWNTNSISQVAAILIDNLYILWNYRGCTVENDWEVRQLLGNLLQNIETELRWGSK